jgi:hypothetical protein
MIVSSASLVISMIETKCRRLRLGSCKVPGRSGERVVELAAALCAVLAAYLVVSASAVPIENFAVPWHHDDFIALASTPGINFSGVRPVSFAFMSVAANLGVGTYYVILVAIWLLDLSLTVLVVRQFYFERPSYAQSAVAALFVCACWFALAPSVATTQYSGLIVNASTYFYAIVAAFLALQTSTRFEMAKWIAFCSLVVLAAFSKEDMFPFLAAILVWRLYCSFEKPGLYSNRATAFALVAVVLVYAASFVHGVWAGSPYIFGSGAYDMSNPLGNIAKNILNYLAASTASAVMYVFLVLELIAVVVFRSYVTKFVYVRILALLMCAGALAAPYLLLPRFIDYYSANFVPFLLAAFAVTLLFLLRTSWRLQERSALLLTVLVGVLSFAGLWTVDATERTSILRWYEEMRTNSRHQLQELARLSTLGLKECKKVRVQGVSATFGPFLDTTPYYVDKFFGRKLDWEIEAEPSSLLAGFAVWRQINEPRWKFILSNDGGQPTYDCVLRFNSTTLYATLSLR